MIWRVLLFELVLLLVVAGVWLLAPLVGITSVLWRLLIIGVLVVPPLAIVVWKLIQQRRAARGLETAMNEQGRAHQEGVRPDRRAEIRELGEAFSQAISSLKRSKLAGASGSTALYALPWYMIIGPPAAGKSTALLRSGLNFPFTPGTRRGVRGVGGTRNCDWWFSDQAILLDTAGRYAAEDDDMDEWLAFLRMLRKYRKKRPLNGLLVAVSVADIATAPADQLDELAEQIRNRIDQVAEELRLALPVYLLFTKCDLISGFVELFGDLKKSARSQVLGFTTPLSQSETDIESLFRSEFSLLSERLRDRALKRLARARTEQRAAVYQFPLQFAAIEDALARFTSQLLAPNPYREAPRLRGVYFCSGTQEGRPIDRVLSAMTRALGLRELGDQMAGQAAQESTQKSYFLRDVFTRVVFPDRNLVGATAAGQKRRRRLGLVGLGAAALAAVLILGGAAGTFVNNRRLISSTVELAKSSRLTTPDDPRRVTDSLKAIDKLGERVDRLRSYAKDAPPWGFRLGFYQGSALLEPAQRVYAKRMRRAFVNLAGEELEATLADVAAATDAETQGAARDFDLLKTYLMVTEPKRLQNEVASAVLLEQWKKRLHPDVAQEHALLRRNVERYLRLLAAGELKWPERDKDLVRAVRQALRTRDAEYRRLVGEPSKLLRPFTLRDALRGRVQAVIAAKGDVPGVYTRVGWSRTMRSRLARKAVSGASIEPWVLGEQESEELGNRLRQRYFDEYIAAWQRFLRGLSVEPPLTAEQALHLLEKLTEPPALYEDLFKAVVLNTQLALVDVPTGGAGGLSKLVRGKAGKALKKANKLGLDKMAGKALGDKSVTPVSIHFLPLKELVDPSEGVDGRPQVSGLQQYLAQLESVRDALAGEIKDGAGAKGGDSEVVRAVEEARRVTKGVLVTLPGSMRRLLQGFLLAPLQASETTAKEAQAGRSAEAFTNELCAVFQEKLAGRYPFARSERDALLQDVVEFFAPSGIVWSYYESNLQARLPRRGDRFQPTDDSTVPAPIVDFINGAWRVRRSLFALSGETPSLRFEVRPRPAVLESGVELHISEIVLEVDGEAKTYRNGPPEQWAVQWSGKGGRSRLLVRGDAGLREEIVYEGDWSLMRLMQRAKTRKRGSWYEAQWTLGRGKIRIPMDIRPERSANPLFEPLTLDCN